jgi:hypothetical protein
LVTVFFRGKREAEVELVADELELKEHDVWTRSRKIDFYVISINRFLNLCMVLEFLDHISLMDTPGTFYE